jgi:hypothetical protein
MVTTLPVALIAKPPPPEYEALSVCEPTVKGVLRARLASPDVPKGEVPSRVEPS